jgi:hypothetical protein
MKKSLGLGLIAVALYAQAQRPPVVLEQPDAQRTKQELAQLLERYPPTLREVLALDPSLLSNQPYLNPYPALVNFLSSHPEVARNPEFYIEQRRDQRRFNQDSGPRMSEMSREIVNYIGGIVGFAMGIGLLTWLIRTFIDYRRWNRLAKVQTEVHTRLLDRFSTNEELLQYIQSPAGSKFLQSAPIALDAGPRSIGAPLSRILWSVQAGLVLAAGGVGLLVGASQIGGDAYQPLHVLGILSMALGIAFTISAGASFLISKRLGLIENAQ